jgi:hypothetical protein
MFLGGLGKMFAWNKFVDTASAGFVSSPLPMPFAKGFLYCVPVIELALGAWLISTFRREWALLGIGALLIVFQLGHMMMQDFPGLSRVIVDLLLVAGCLALPPFRFARSLGHRESDEWAARDAVLVEH